MGLESATCEVKSLAWQNSLYNKPTTLTYYLSGLSQKWPFLALKDRANSKCSYFNNMKVTKCNLAKMFPGQLSSRKCHLNPDSGYHSNAGAGNKGETAFKAFFSTLKFLKWCQICMYISLLRNMISCLHIAQFLGSTQPRFFSARGADAPFEPYWQTDSHPLSGTPTLWNVYFTGAAREKKSIIYKFFQK